MSLLGRLRGIMARASCDSFFRLTSGDMLWRCVAYNLHSAWEQSRKEELARGFANYHVFGLQELNAKNTLQTLFAVLIELGLFEWGHPGGSQHAA